MRVVKIKCLLCCLSCLKLMTGSHKLNYLVFRTKTSEIRYVNEFALDVLVG